MPTSVQPVLRAASAMAAIAVMIMTLGACGPKGNGLDNQNQAVDAGPAPVGLELSPATATIEVVDGSPVSQAFVATLLFAGGGRQDGGPGVFRQL